MAASIDALREIAAGRTVAVLGDMLELGEFAVEAHRKIGEKLIDKEINIVVTVGELAGEIAQIAAAAGRKAFACDDHDAARKVLLQILQPGDTVLLKGSRGMKMEKLLDIFA
jgi:UDP-N-acetylmuramoyl-tripeptide--D-alanyl-D-alanine ligase